MTDEVNYVQVTLEKRALSQRRLKSNENIKILLAKPILENDQNNSNYGFMTQRFNNIAGNRFDSTQQFTNIKQQAQK